MNQNKIFAWCVNLFRIFPVRKNRITMIEKLDTGGSGSLHEVEKECRCFPRACRYSVSKKEAKKKVLKTFKSAAIVKITKKTWKHARVYKITFTTPTYRAAAVVHGRSGKIIAWEKNFR